MDSIAIIGVGAVGSAIAQALIAKDITTELILLDKDEQRCAGEVQDLSDTLNFSRTSKIVQGTYTDIQRAKIVILSAGRRQKPGETRLELIEQNKKVFDSILGNLSGLRDDAIVIVVTNPLDALTYCSLGQLGLPAKQVFGTGTYIDTQRFAKVLSDTVDVAPEAIDTLVVGEHGDSMVFVWSATRIAGSPVEQFGLTKEHQDAIAQQVRKAAYTIIENKGATYYGIAASVAQLCLSIVYDTGSVVPVSWFHADYGVCMSLPVQITRSGIKRTFVPSLSPEEQEELHRSAQLLKSYQARIDN